MNEFYYKIYTKTVNYVNRYMILVVCVTGYSFDFVAAEVVLVAATLLILNVPLVMLLLKILKLE